MLGTFPSLIPPNLFIIPLLQFQCRLCVQFTPVFESLNSVYHRCFPPLVQTSYSPVSLIRSLPSPLLPRSTHFQLSLQTVALYMLFYRRHDDEMMGPLLTFSCRNKKQKLVMRVEIYVQSRCSCFLLKLPRLYLYIRVYIYIYIYIYTYIHTHIITCAEYSSRQETQQNCTDEGKELRHSYLVHVYIEVESCIYLCHKLSNNMPLYTVYYTSVNCSTCFGW